jgi:hypothetical protein
MNRTKLKNYAPQARRDFIRAMTDRAAFYGLTATKTESVVERGDVAVIAGREHPRAVAKKRKLLEDRIRQHGFGPTMEALAYTWFNRLVAVRYMELHGYLDHGYRVLSHPEGKPTPEIVEQAEHVELPGLKKDVVIDLKLAGNKEGALYRLLLTAQCNALHSAMPFLFEKIDDETELLLPDNLLNSDSLIRKLVNDIDEEDWKEVEIIGWLYQFYISDKKDEVIGKVVASEDIPAATQLFTPNWIVKYLVQNTLGRQWLATYPQSPVRQQMAYYIEPAEQTPDVQAQLKAITPTSLNPEELTMLDPACGSGHILVEGYDLFKAIYTERGYNKREIPRLILQKNLFGLEIDDRAAQLAAFALMMKARPDDRRILDSEIRPNILAIQETDAEFDAELLPDLLSPHRNIIEEIAELFRKAKTFGSLVQIPGSIAARIEELEKLLHECLKQGDLVSTVSARHILTLLRQLRALANQYDAVVANPPYMGSKYYTPALKAFVNRQYKEAKADLYACFMERNKLSTKPTGLHGMINIPNWMFLSSFEELRKSLFETQTIDTFVHNGRGVFGSDFGSCAFVLRKAHLPEYRGSYRRLFEKQGNVASNEELETRFHTAKTHTPSNSDFPKIPGSPVAYWASANVLRAYGSGPALNAIAKPCVGMTTGNNERFVRMWHEIDIASASFDSDTREAASATGKKWFPCNKGGEFLRWFGNNTHVVNWQSDGAELQSSGACYPRSKEWYFKPCITWTAVSSSFFAYRYCDAGFIPITGGSSIYAHDADSLKHLTLFLMSNTSEYLLESKSASINIEAGDIGSLPVLPLPQAASAACTEIFPSAISIARADWNSFERSWDFATLPVLQHKDYTLRLSQEAADAECRIRFARMRKLEEENNRQFIDAYDLQDELTPDVPDDQITLYRPDRKNDSQRLVSYAIGCMMGRYSLDKPGLIYAHSGNQGFDASQYKTFRADDDGIVPLLETDWGIRDDATSRFVEFIGVAWPKQHLEENLKFVAASLGTTAGEQSRDTIRRYLATGFYKHHLQMYKKRPIYWLFSSGKLRAFQCLVYLHRYNEGTLARMRTEYVIPLQGLIASRIEQLEGDKLKATSTSHRKKLQKEQDDLKKKQTELATFEEKLKHAADQKITLDLDDGVKVNYGKFGDLLAESKAICGAKEEE